MRYYGLSAVLVGLLVLGACGGGDGLEGESSAAAEGTAAAAVSGDDPTPSGAARATPVERRTGVSDAGSETATSSETVTSFEGGTGTAGVRATSGAARPTEEAAARVVEEEESEYEIHYVIARDQIPAILDPQFLDAGEAIEAYNEHEQVLGLSIDGDHRAYPIPYLSQHEIVNDVVGGQPVAVTW